jgi:hypothetical protein
MGISLLTYFYTRAQSLSRDGVRPAAVTLVGDGKLDTLTLGQRDPWLLLANDAGCTLERPLKP